MEGLPMPSEESFEISPQLQFAVGYLENLGREKHPIKPGDIVIILNGPDAFKHLRVVTPKIDSDTELIQVQRKDQPNTPTFPVYLSGAYHVMDFNDACVSALKYEDISHRGTFN